MGSLREGINGLGHNLKLKDYEVEVMNIVLKVYDHIDSNDDDKFKINMLKGDGVYNELKYRIDSLPVRLKQSAVIAAVFNKINDKYKNRDKDTLELFILEVSFILNNHTSNVKLPIETEEFITLRRWMKGIFNYLNNNK